MVSSPPPFPSAFTVAADWVGAAKELTDGLTATPVNPDGLGVLYVADRLEEDLSSILTFLRQTTGVAEWIGTLGAGVIGGAKAAYDRPGATAMILDLPPDVRRVLSPTPVPDRLEDDVRDWVRAAAPVAGLVHADGGMPDIAEALSTLAARTGTFLIGGLTCSRGAQAQIAGGIVNGGISGALFSPAVGIVSGVTQGCTPLGEMHTVTEGAENVIVTLDGRQALDVFKEDIGEMLARDLGRVAGYVHAALPVAGTDTRDYLVRNLIGIDPERGWLAIGNEVRAGDRIMFVRRDPMSAQTDLRRMLDDVMRRLDGPARGAVYVSCVARGPAMFGDEGREAAIVAESLGGAPVIGFYANGEISNDRLYSYTGVLMAFC
ncbi:MAG: FIST C-terminal domain-containing protein [Proteobacteria bacterium]|nr:FIST C-terminal domain-containing protein [Pseudomonadota bacterium]